MSDTVISVESLSKQYRLGQIGGTTLREDLQRWWARLRHQPDPTLKVTDARAREPKAAGGFPPQVSGLTPHPSERPSPYVWALRDVSFEVKRGEVLGIIGRNGAGKSTLLKILSRITAPTTGRVRVKGRIASLLEIGTGMHPELTGRENIYLNGAILGMTKAEIAGKLDEIIAFSGVERYIDTPVKRYSSGMMVRLGFAVAAHLEPEILIVDEVLAVGDAEFQKKCLGKMQDVAIHGRTVLFVSHNLGAVARLCARSVVLGAGRLLADSCTASAILFYSAQGRRIPSQLRWAEPDGAPGDNIVRLKSVRILDAQGEPVATADIRMPLVVEVQYWYIGTSECPTAILHFKDELNNTLFATNEFNAREWRGVHRQAGVITARCCLPGNLFAEGRITVLVAINTYNPTRIHTLIDDAVSFEVVDHSNGDGVRGPVVGYWPGLVRPWVDWKTARS